MDSQQQLATESTTYSDSSEAIFSMYTRRAQKFDEENAENWKGGADGILVFTGLFSSTVATFIAISYPNLQQNPNVTTQSLLAQISQQLSNSTTGSTASTASASIESSFVPPASAVFINSVWFLSLVLSLTCALMATLLQQWARRYLQMVQRNHAPHVRAHIREYFARGALRFGISELVELLPSLLLISILLFFAGLVVFAFRASHVVAYFTLAVVAFCVLSYIAFTLTPLISHDCPYHTPLTSLLWFCTHEVPLSLIYNVHRGATKLHERWPTVSGDVVKLLQGLYNNMEESLSGGMFSMLENSAKSISMDIYRTALIWTLGLLDEDQELEEFVAGVPGLYLSEALTPPGDSDDPRRDIRTVLAVLPGPTSFNEPLPWSIIGLAQRAIASNLPEPIRRQRIKACLNALYYIPGAIRDVLAPYATKAFFCLEIAPFLNSPDSLKIIEELWDTPNDDVALSVRCAAAVVTAFMVTPPRSTLDAFLNPSFPFIGGEKAGKCFLSKRLGINTGADADDSGGAHNLHGDTARLQNLVRFLEDVNTALGYMDKPWWVAGTTLPVVREERRKLHHARNTTEYRAGRSTFEQHGDRASPAFIPAAQHDLIALTLEILTRDPVADAGPPQREAFRTAYMALVHMARAHVRERAQALALPLVPLADSVETVLYSLERVAQSLRLQIDDVPAPNDDGPSTSPSTSQMPTLTPRSVSTVVAAARAGPALRLTPPALTIIMGVSSHRDSSASSSVAPASTAGEGRLDSPSALV